MAFSCMYPNMVNRLVSLDASPIDRMNFPHLNQSSQEMIENAMALGSLEGMSLENAIKKIKNEVEDQVLQTALLFNLKAIYENQENIYGFPEVDKSFEGSCLMLNGSDSFQREILDDVKFYNRLFPNITND